MTSREFIEHFLYYTFNNPKIVESLEIAKVISTEREILPVFRDLEIVEKFKKPKFLILIDKLIYVYLITSDSRGLNVIEIIGDEIFYYYTNKTKLLNIIKGRLKEDENLYLPLPFYRKIIFINPDYSNREPLTDKEVTVFSRNDLTGSFWGTKSSWSTKIEDYSLENRSSFTDYTREILAYLVGEV